MRFVQGDDRSTEITWYFCDKDAQPGPYSLFASGNWSSDPIWPWLGVGEVKGAPRVWVDGENPWGFKGDHRCGTDQQFAEGLTTWPAPSQWTWCCQQWTSNPCLCLLPRPAAEAEVPGASYVSAEFTEAEPARFPWRSIACLCLDPFSAPASVPSSSYAHPLPAIRRVPWHSLACLCLDPFSAPASVPSSSYAHPLPAIRRVPWHSLACLCLDPSARESEVKGHSSSVPLPARKFGPWSSRACLCLDPRSVTGHVSPAAYGYGSKPTPAPAYVSRACLCLDPRSVTGHVSPAAYGYGSKPTPAPAYVSRACLCLDPFAHISELPNVGYSGSSGGTANGVLVPCCPGHPIPMTLNCFFTNETGSCGCLPASRPLVWDATGQWALQGTLCGSPATFKIGCLAGTSASNFAIETNFGFSEGGGFTLVSARCNPFQLVYDVVGCFFPCAGNFRMTISE